MVGCWPSDQEHLSHREVVCKQGEQTKGCSYTSPRQQTTFANQA